MNDWNIQSRAHACETCGEPFADKQAYHTLLFDDPPDLRRLDICDACWQKQRVDQVQTASGLISRWQGVYELPPPPTEPIQRENAESLLRKLIELNDPAQASAVYILAVMLERKRLLKVKEEFRHEGKRIFIYEQPGTGDVFTIADPELKLDQLDEVQRNIAMLLEQGSHPSTTSEPPVAGDPARASDESSQSSGSEPRPREQPAAT